jgi:PAS domain S-box-containing protein
MEMKKFVRGCVVLIAAIAGAVLLRLAVGNSVPLVTMFGAVAFSVYLAGYRTALFTAVLGYVVIDWWFIVPRHVLSPLDTADVVSFSVYMLSCLLIILMGGALRRSRRRALITSAQLEVVAGGIAAGVTYCSRDMRYLWVNQHYCDWIRRPADKLVGRSIEEVVGPEAFAQLLPLYTRVLAGETVRYEKEVQFKDSPPSWISVVYTPTMDENGIVDGWVAVVLDIGERKRAELELRSSRKRIQSDLDALTRLQDVANLCGAADSQFDECLLALLDAAIEFTGADKGNVQLFDQDTEVLRLIAHRGFDAPFLTFFETVGASHSAACGSAIAERARVIVEDVSTSPIFRGTPSLQVMLDADVRAVQSTPLLTGEGQLIGMISTHCASTCSFDERALRWMDVLARQAADFVERKLAEEGLREADRRKDEFLAVLSHELRNPLAPIGYAVEILKKGDALTPPMQKAREVIQRQVRQLSRLIDDLMDVSRITRGTIGLRRQHIELRSIVNDAVETSRPLIEQAGHTLRVELPVEPVIVHADATRLAQVLMNLLNNAAKYTERGGRIDLLAAVEGETLVIRVRDTGVGIPAQMLGRVFEMFAQEDRSLERSRGGLGIGLSLARRLVAMHDGELEAHSDGPGHGSEFIVRLPVSRNQHGSSETPLVQPEAVHPLRILVVDDNEDAAESMSMFLAMLGHEVQSANNGLEAVEKAATFQPAAVLLDLGLPVLNGYEAAQRIRTQRGDDVVLVAVTGWGQEEDRKRSRAAGFDYHLTKPVALDEVKRLLSAARMPAPKA